MAYVLVSLQVSFCDETDSHCILPVLGHVDRRFYGISQFQLVGFDWNYLNQRHFLDQVLRQLIIKAFLFYVPASSFEVKALDVASMFWFFLYICCVLFFCNSGVHDRLV